MESYTKKRGKLNHSRKEYSGKDRTQFRTRERISSSMDRSRRRVRLRIPLTRACVHG